MQTQINAGNTLATTPQHGEDDTLLTSSQVRESNGAVSNMCIWRWMRDPRVQFPKPVKINGRNYWYRGEIRRWKAERREQQAA